MNNSTIVAVVIGALIIGGGGGYFAGANTVDSSVDTRALQEAVAMMNDQSATIMQMGEMMKQSGVSMQKMGMQYQDDAVIQQGKDLQAVGEKYQDENAGMSSEDHMKGMAQ